MKLFEAYLGYLTTHPDTVNSIIVWTVVQVFFYITLFKYRAQMVKGAEGSNGIWELSEQWSYMAIWVVFPVVTYSAFFRYDLPTYMWAFIAALVAYIMGGPWLLEWALAMITRTKMDEKSKTTVKTEVKTETETEIK